MKFEIENGAFVGTAEWRAPGRIEFQVNRPEDHRFLERYFTTPYSALEGPVDCPEMQHEDPDSSEEAFERAMHRLGEHAYKVRCVDDRSGETTHLERQSA